MSTLTWAMCTMTQAMCTTLTWAICRPMCTLTWAGKGAQSVSPCCQQSPLTFSPTPACECAVVHQLQHSICHHTLAKEDMQCSPPRSLSGHNPCLRNAPNPGEGEGSQLPTPPIRTSTLSTFSTTSAGACLWPRAVQLKGGDNLHLPPLCNSTSAHNFGDVGEHKQRIIKDQGSALASPELRHLLEVT